MGLLVATLPDGAGLWSTTCSASDSKLLVSEQSEFLGSGTVLWWCGGRVCARFSTALMILTICTWCSRCSAEDLKLTEFMLVCVLWAFAGRAQPAVAASMHPLTACEGSVA